MRAGTLQAAAGEATARASVACWSLTALTDPEAVWHCEKESDEGRIGGREDASLGGAGRGGGEGEARGVLDEAAENVLVVSDESFRRRARVVESKLRKSISTRRQSRPQLERVRAKAQE